jgi:NADPH-dependent 2,4-dienoyl-CoA reductase/sulfur reductase-like enzyme
MGHHQVPTSPAGRGHADMRVSVAGVRRDAGAIELRLEDQPLSAHTGESVAAALVANGCWHFRDARDGEPRGLFCGMGVCGECTMLVDGVPKRTCLEPVRAGMQLQRQPALAAVPAALEPSGRTALEVLEVEVLVVGAGPAGLAAAAAAARQGADVLVIDERGGFGGQYYKQPGRGFGIEESALDRQFAAGRARYREAVDAGAKFLFAATVWGAFGPGELAVGTAERQLRIRARRLVLAPGAYERALPVPGWTLPGVLTTGAAQTLLRSYSVAPGKRVLIAGNGPLNLQVARELLNAGVAVVAVVESAPAPTLRRAGDLLRLALHAPDLAFDGLGHLATLARHGVPIEYSSVLSRCDPGSTGGRVGSATICRLDAAGKPLAGSERQFAVDAVCMGYGFAPQSELPRAIGCRYAEDGERGTLRVLRDADGRSSVPEVFVVGDAGGLGGARLAEAQGMLAGAAAAADLGHASDARQTATLRAAGRDAARQQRFQTALWRVYRGPLFTYEQAGADTLLCRCELVERGAVERCLKEGAGSVGSLKRLTRAGMGRCQGRYCGPSLRALSNQGGMPAADDGEWFAPRPPFKPMRIDQLAATPAAADTGPSLATHRLE